MKRKSNPASQPVIPPEILEEAQKSLRSDTLKAAPKCVICGSPCAPNSTEGLCWVCRRLKISAWREGEYQASAQE
jgi:hypothetical protein